MIRSNFRAAPILSLALVACAPAGSALAAPIVVLNTGEHRDTIISRGEHRIHIFQDTLEIDSWPTPGGDAIHTLLIDFQYSVAEPGELTGAIIGNELPLFPPLPLQTPSLMTGGGLRIEGSIIDANQSFVRPSYDPDTSYSAPAFIAHGTGPFDSFNLSSFSDGDVAYIGFSDANVRVFGYMQIERQSVLDWKLIGYAFDPSGAPVLVENLIPAPASLAALGMTALTTRRRRIAS
jgi:hypothetical protein